MKRKINILLSIVMFFALLQLTSASIKLENIYFDPAIISAGDNVDIVVEYSATNMEVDKIGNPEYKFAVELKPDDDLSKEYVLIVDKLGNNLRGTVLAGEVYNKVFRIKVDNDAPPADYEFKLVGRWYKNGIPEKISTEIKFMVPIKKEGIILNVANLNTNPSQVRPGDKFVEIKTFIENVGQKDSKSVEVILTPNSNLITSTYTDNNRKWIGKIKSGESKEISFYLNIDENILAKLYDLDFTMNYMDLDDNKYSKNITVPFLIKDRSYIEVINYSGSGLAGSKGTLKVYIKNTGSQSAESVDVRILKESSQPFNFDVRSSYVGELEAGEVGTAIFNFGIEDSAAIKTHDFKILIRTKGDTDEGDDTIYTYNRRAQFNVIGVAENNYLKYGSYLFIGVLVLFIFLKLFSKKNKKK